jgi:hypothetical protein
MFGYKLGQFLLLYIPYKTIKIVFVCAYFVSNSGNVFDAFDLWTEANIFQI